MIDQARGKILFIGGDEYEGHVTGAEPIGESMTVRKRGVVGVVGLGIMGGAFAQHLRRRRLARHRLRHRRGAPPRAQARRCRDRRRCRRAGAGGADHHREPAQPRRARRDGSRHRQGRRAAPRGDRSVDLRARRQGSRRGGVAGGRPRPARLPGERHRRAGQDQGHRRLCLGRRRRDQAAHARYSPRSAAPCTISAHSATAAA